MRNLICLIFFVCMHTIWCPVRVFSQSILLSNSDFPNEATVYINPGNPSNIIVGGAVGQVFVSQDSGNTWITGELDKEYGLWSDPSVIIDEEGSYFYFHLSGAVKGLSSDRIVCQKSTNGQSWKAISTPGYNPNTCQERPYAVYDFKRKRILLTYIAFDSYGSKAAKDSTRLFFTFSDDKGVTWSEPTRINKWAGDCSDQDGSVQGATTAITTTGEYFVCWGLQNKILINKSTDGGVTWLQEERIIATQTNGWDYLLNDINMPNGLPALTSITSKKSKYKNTIAAVYTEQTDSKHTYLKVITSADMGETWSTPATIGDTATGVHWFHPWISSDLKKGHLAISAYKHTTVNGRTEVKQVTFVSLNGGKSFSEIQDNDPVFYPVKDDYLGDMGTITIYGNSIYKCWIKAEHNKNELYFRINRFKLNSIR